MFNFLKQVAGAAEAELKRAQGCISKGQRFDNLGTIIKVAGCSLIGYGLIQQPINRNFLILGGACLFVGYDTCKLGKGYLNTASSLQDRVATAFVGNATYIPAWLWDFSQASEKTICYKTFNIISIEAIKLFCSFRKH